MNDAVPTMSPEVWTVKGLSALQIVPVNVVPDGTEAMVPVTL